MLLESAICRSLAGHQAYSIEWLTREHHEGCLPARAMPLCDFLVTRWIYWRSALRLPEICHARLFLCRWKSRKDERETAIETGGSPAHWSGFTISESRPRLRVRLRDDFHKKSTHSAWTSWQPWRVHCLNAGLEQPWPAELIHCVNAVLEFRPEPETANISPCRMA